ncbi:uncharacterized protein [Diadema setosum]|uniref:uncharacterized protein n=1 Tax=Diadema setosum TaxID=31175 RepID=UPI003B3B62F1
MTKPEQSKPQLSCQELSKQCNDIELSSSVTADGCWSRSNPQTQRNRQSSQYSTRNHIKVSIGIQSRLSELTEFQGLEPDLKRCSSNEPALQRQRRYLNGFGSDDDCFVVDANKEADVKCRKQAYYKTCGWLPKEVADYTHVDDNEDFLEELESSVRDQLDRELEVFRSNLLAIIGQQHAQCREYFSQESQDCFSQLQPPSEETCSEGRQTPSPVPDILDADSMWPSEESASSVTENI